MDFVAIPERLDAGPWQCRERNSKWGFGSFRLDWHANYGSVVFAGDAGLGRRYANERLEWRGSWGGFGCFCYANFFKSGSPDFFILRRRPSMGRGILDASSSNRCCSCSSRHDRTTRTTGWICSPHDDSHVSIYRVSLSHVNWRSKVEPKSGEQKQNLWGKAVKV